MKALKSIRPGSSSLVGDENLFDLRSGVRAKAQRILCSFPEVLTEREQIVLHCLARGVAARDIAKSTKAFQPARPAG